MNNSTQLTLEILKLIASFLTPVIILIFGIVINRKLENAKSILSKEKDWQTWWADKLLNVCHNYNSSITDIVVYLSQAIRISEEQLSGWENELHEKEIKLREALRRLEYLDWEIKNYTQFSHKHGYKVLDKAKQLFSLIGNLQKNKQGNLEDIRKLQFQFNKAVRLAHAEILELPSR
ncbi:hypothetical protein [Cyanothece sp. BG0011]|uniref:hypothetical protein n=1 Tax=Cyanothece sp. BG0011 TaxID=2082950 RepID=UPI000D1DEDA7|nr:hypothetical protein [Cyanothece sp. BG0011]